jgi:cell division protein FtsZ
MMFQECEQIEGQEDGLPVIKVVGVGGAGGNAINRMIASGMRDVEFIAINTDAQDLARNQARNKLPLGKLGAGGKPEAGRAAAEARREDIRALLKGANIVFITAGMGGGTGTGAAPVVAEVAKEMDILTVGVVTKPFADEGKRRMQNAEAGIEELTKNLNAYLVSLNDKLMETLDDDVLMDDAFAASDDVLKNAVAGIVEIIVTNGQVNVDFNDVKTAMSYTGRALMGTGIASGEKRARTAAEMAVDAPLLEGMSLKNAKALLVNITASRTSFKMREKSEVMDTVQELTDAEEVFWGMVYDENMGDELRVTVIATGIDAQSEGLTVIDTQQAEPEEKLVAAGGARVPFGIRAPSAAGASALPGIIRSSRGGAALGNSVEVPACLRRQAD